MQRPLMKGRTQCPHAAWRVIGSVEQSDKTEDDEQQAVFAREYAAKVEVELQKVISSIPRADAQQSGAASETSSNADGRTGSPVREESLRGVQPAPPQPLDAALSCELRRAHTSSPTALRAVRSP